MNGTNNKVRAFDERRNIAMFSSREDALAFCVSDFFKQALKAIQQRHFFSVALSGGSTPIAIFRLIASSPEREKIDWTRVFLFWSDERAVAKDDPQSNYKMAMEAGFATLPIPKENVFRMHAEVDPAHHAKEYEQQILKTLEGDSFDMIMLGVGEDGHTASLFPKTHALHPAGQLVVANFVPEKDVWRMTLTFECINKAKHIVVYALGKEKAAVVHNVLTGPYEPDLLPAQRIGSPTHKALWIMDEEASALLKNAK